MIVIDEKLLASFRGPGICEWCKRYAGHRHAAHVRPRQMGGGSRLDVRINLISLCWFCHLAQHEGREPTRADLEAVVAAREQRFQDDIEAECLAIRRKRGRQ